MIVHVWDSVDMVGHVIGNRQSCLSEGNMFRRVGGSYSSWFSLTAKWCTRQRTELIQVLLEVVGHVQRRVLIRLVDSNT